MCLDGKLGSEPVTRTPYDRRRILERAERAERRGQTRRAIGLYRWVLAVERNNPQLHARLAPLLARIGQDFDAWQSYRCCAETALREQREERALALYRDACRTLPRELEAWQRLAQLLARRGESREALATLLEGSRHFRRRRHRTRAIHLLRLARAVAPWDPDCVLALCGLLARTRQSHEALLLLDGLSRRVDGRALRRVRGAQLRIEGSFAAFWRWLRCVITSGQAHPGQLNRAAP